MVEPIGNYVCQANNQMKGCHSNGLCHDIILTGDDLLAPTPL